MTGEDKAPIIIFLLGVPDVKTAMDHAIEKVKCAFGLSDEVIYQLNHALLFGTNCFSVEGTQIIYKLQIECKSQSDVEPLAGSFYLSEIALS
ncbi:hypothetical protein WKH36_13460 [Pantoea agglomerans]|jgi:hypothetical protein